MFFFSGNRALIAFCEHIFATNGTPMFWNCTYPFYAGILMDGIFYNSMQNCVGYTMLVLFLQHRNLLPLRRNEPIDFRYLPIEVAHNLVLLFTRWNRNLQMTNILITNRLANAATITIKHLASIV